MKQGVKYVAGGLLAALLLWFVFRNTNLVELRAAIARVSIAGLLLGGAVNLAHNAFRVWRWGLLLRPIRSSISFRSRFRAVIIGYMTTWLVPGRLGELVRPALLSARENIPLGPCLGSVVADRLLDGAAILALFAVGTTFSTLRGPASGLASLIRGGAIVSLVAIVAAFVLLLGAGAGRAGLSRWVGARRSRAARWIGRVFVSLAEGTDALRRPRLLFPILLHSLLVWITIAVGTWLGVRACRADVSLWDVFVLLPPLALGVALPTPGGAGGYHLVMKVALVGLYGVPEAVAVSAGILFHLMIIVPVIALGTVFLFLEGISWRALLESVRRIGEPGADRSEAPVAEAAS